MFETIYGVTTERLLSADNLAAERGGRLLFSGRGVDIAPGTFTLLRGANGAGKTTLLRILAGLTEPASGTISRSASVCYWGHTSAVKDELTALENLELLCTSISPKNAQNVPSAQIFLPALDRVGLRTRAHVLARRLSAGQRRRIGVAWLALTDAKVWLLDEPTAALDTQGCALLAEVLNAHLSAGGAVLAATHLDIDGVNVAPKVLELT